MATEKPKFADLNPRDLTIEANVRREAGLTAEFVDSVKEYGVLTPILVQRVADGTLRVRAGQRRTLAAIEAGQETVPARIVEGDDDQARRIIEQIIENEQRSSLIQADLTNGFEQLSLLGMSAVKIAKTTGAKKETVTAALKVSKSKQAVTAQADYGLTIDQAAVLAEFDDAEAIEELTKVAMERPGQLDHEAQRIRDEHEHARCDAEAREALAATGVRVIDEPGWGNTKTLAVSSLVDDHGKRLGVEEHQTCPGHCAYIHHRYDKSTATIYVCDDYKARGHRKAGEKHSAKNTQDLAIIERERAERARVMKGNKDWRAAETVRRRWFMTFAKTRRTPKDAAAFVAHAMHADMDTLSRNWLKGSALVTEWLGTSRIGLGGDIDRAAPARAQMIALVQVLAAIEVSTGVHTWRNPTRETKAYFAALERWGYTLSDIEQDARGTQPKPADQEQEAPTPQTKEDAPVPAETK